jgi:hypothetical protein
MLDFFSCTSLGGLTCLKVEHHYQKNLRNKLPDPAWNQYMSIVYGNYSHNHHFDSKNIDIIYRKTDIDFILEEIYERDHQYLFLIKGTGSNIFLVNGSVRHQILMTVEQLENIGFTKYLHIWPNDKVIPIPKRKPYDWRFLLKLREELEYNGVFSPVHDEPINYYYYRFDKAPNIYFSYSDNQWIEVTRLE